MRPALLLAGHGSRDKSATASFKKLVQLYRRLHPSWDISHGFLEFAGPSLSQALEAVVKKSADVTILPVFLFAARHWKKDLPAILAETHRKRPETRLTLAPVLGAHSLMGDLVHARIRSIKAKKDSILILVGRGASDPGVKREFFKLAKGLGKKRGYQKVRPCFYDMLHPSLEETLKKETRESLGPVIVMPYLLFPGKVLDSIRQTALSIVPKARLRMAPVLGIHPLLLRLIDERLRGRGFLAFGHRQQGKIIGPFPSRLK